MKPEKKPAKAKSTAKVPAKTPRARKAVSNDAKLKTKPKAELEVPSILLEGDETPPPPVSGPGRRYDLGPTGKQELVAGEPGELPEAYGTQRLLLTARDPHWLYAAWDFTREQLREYNNLARDRHLVLRVYLGSVGGEPFREVHVHPESRNWFVHVGRGGAKFVAQLGYYTRAGKWTAITDSKATLTPPDALSEDTSVQFANVPVEIPFQQLTQLVKEAARENLPLAEAIAQLRGEGHPGLPDTSAIASSQWTAAQENALAGVITMDQVRRVWMGSLEITELIRGQMLRDIASLAVSQFSLPTSPGAASVSSPFGGMEKRRGFWFNVNAELIIYGSTEPDAEVSIGGRVIKLRPDGTFSYRFALPDGKYDLPAIAVSADKEDTRKAELKFSRSTRYSGEVGAHPQDPALRPPLPQNVA
ncbi:MAG: DUF4912 domain-containing protein [Verrucomicrobiota bacterium]